MFADGTPARVVGFAALGAALLVGSACSLLHDYDALGAGNGPLEAGNGALDAGNEASGAAGLRCGSSVCQAPDICCVEKSGTTAPRCTTKSNCSDVPVECDDIGDCPEGMLCCLSRSGQTFVNCQDAAACQSMNGVLLCGENAPMDASVFCPSGQECISTADISGDFYKCEP